MFDLSAGGLAFFGPLDRPNSQDFPVEFRLPGPGDPIRARGKIAWSSKARNLTGICFKGLTDESRIHLGAWIACQADGATPKGSDYISFGFTSRSTEGLRTESESSSYPSKWVLACGIAIVVLLVTLLAVRHHRQRSDSASPQSIVSAVPQAGTEISPKPENTSLETITHSLDEPGFVLQVGAMRQERNADALSNSLKQRGYSVIVFRRATDQFYRVAVGPYSDRSSVDRVKNELKAQSFNGIVTPWAPE